MSTSTERRRSLCVTGRNAQGNRDHLKPSTCWWFICADTRERSHTSALWVGHMSSMIQCCCNSVLCFCCSSKAVIRPTLVWRTWRLTCALILGRNRTCVNTKAVTKPSPMLPTGPNTRTELTPMRYNNKKTLRLSSLSFFFKPYYVLLLR